MAPRTSDRRRQLSVWAAAVLVTPVLHALGFPLQRWWWLEWVAFVPWFYALRLSSTRAALVISSLTTLLGSYYCTPWLPRAVADYYQQPLILGLLLFGGVWLLTVAPYIAGFTFLYRRLAQHQRLWLPLLGGMAWAGMELARTRLFIGDPFGLFGYTQLDQLWLLQIADITGVYGVSFVLAAANIAVVELLLLRHPTRATSQRAAIGGLLTVVAAIACVGIYGAVRLQQLVPDEQDGAAVVITQGNLDLGAQWKRESYGLNLDAYMRLTAAALKQQPATLVVWPESAMTFFLENEASYRAALGALLKHYGVEMIAGGPRIGATPEQYYNTAFLVRRDGEIGAAYDKQRLLPFAEYFPLRSIELLRRNFARVTEFTAGGPARLLPTSLGDAGIVICNEVMFGETVAERVRAGAAFVVTLTNDSWLGDVKYAEQAFDMARLRAIEQRRYLIRASTSGPSAIVAPSGAVQTRTDVNVATTLHGTIQPRHEQTWYARLGDSFGVLCILVPLAVIWWQGRTATGTTRGRW